MHVIYVAHSNVERLQINIQYIELFTEEPVHYHIISYYKPSIVAKGKVSFYGFDRCKPAEALLPFISTNPLTMQRSYHLNICRLYAAEILPDTVETALFLDMDTIVTRSLSFCYPTFDKATEYIAMTRDTGGVCQHKPDNCWPIGFTWNPPAWMRCNRSRVQHSCSIHRHEPVTFNAGVIGMNLKRMREVHFTQQLENTVWQTYRSVRRGAIYADQDFLNNYLRFHPSALSVLPCECNYQFSSARKGRHCANKRIAIAHAWSIAKASDPLLKAMKRFDRMARWRSYWSVKSATANMHDMRFDGTCPHQPWMCNENLSRPTHRHTRVFYLTRTMGRPRFYRSARESVRRQSHSHVTHMVFGDTYADEKGVDFTPFSLDTAPESACDVCGATPTSRCTQLPRNASVMPEAFQDCYCSLSYPPNTMVRSMQDIVLRRQSDGFVVILDDDKVLADEHVTTRVLSLAEPDDRFLLWRSATGRYIPSRPNFDACRIQQGDIDGANALIHTSVLRHGLWTGRRCSDYRSISGVSRRVSQRCVPIVGIVNNPLQYKSGGVGKREDLQDRLKITLVTTTTNKASDDRLRLLARSATYYRDYCGDLIAKRILVWNAPQDADIPAHLRPLFDVVVRTNNTHLENRWLLHTEVTTAFVLNLDDDSSVTRKGIECLLANANEDSAGVMWGPFSRRVVNGRYVLEENYRSTYSIVLPRVVLFRSSLLRSFATFWATYPKKNVSRRLLSDDIVFNMVVASTSAPARWVILPKASFVESRSTGIYNDKARQQVRNAAIRDVNHTWPVFSSCRACDENIIAAPCSDRRALIQRMKVAV